MNERFSCVEVPSCSDMAAHISCGGLNWVNTCGGEIVGGAIKGGNRPDEPLYVARVLAPDGQYHPCKAAQSHGRVPITTMTMLPRKYPTNMTCWWLQIPVW